MMSKFKKFIWFWVIVCLIFAFGWVKNVIKFSDCDFQSPYKCEVIHGVGLFPVVGGITGWLNVGK